MIPQAIYCSRRAEDGAIYKENRLGVFRISGDFVREHPADLLSIFALMVPIRCEHLFAQDAFECVAYSPLFEKVSDDEEMPRYRIECEEAAPRQVVVRAAKEDE